MVRAKGSSEGLGVMVLGLLLILRLPRRTSLCEDGNCSCYICC